MTGLDTHILLRAFCDELVRCGITDACTSPGSRCAPLVLALVRDGRLACHSHIDERCAGFFALGLAKASRRPAVVTCTSGTAAANLAPAVHEAREARVPLVVLTADRPPELRDVGAGQVIDQLGLFGGAAKWFVELGTHTATPERLRWIRALACRAVWTAGSGRPGVVHINVALREPLVPGAPLPPDASGRPDGRPWVAAPPAGTAPSPEALEAFAGLVEARPRGVVVAGRSERDPALPAAIAGFAETAGYPVLADPLSGARRGPHAVAHYDALLRVESFSAGHEPELVVRIGDLPTSKPLRAWLAGLQAPQVSIDAEDSWQDPEAVVGLRVAADPATTLADTTAGVARGADPAWVRSWRAADARAAEVLETELGSGLSEPWVAARLTGALSEGTTLWVASSMPVRDVESFAAVRDDPPRVLSNRGANGIDGTISAAFGAAVHGPTTLLIGDVAFAHDLGGLLAARRLGLALTIVLVDNDGGGIFHFLPIAGETDVFEDQVATPHGLEAGTAAALFGCDHVLAEDRAGFDSALAAARASARTTIIEVRTDRADNVALHRSLAAAVQRVLDAAG